MICELCGKPAECTHHWLFGYGVRDKADADKIYGRLCNKCHNLGLATLKIHDNVMAERLSKMYGQALWEINEVERGYTRREARQRFIKRYGMSYIWDEV